MPIKGILLIFVAVIVLSAVQKDIIYDWLEDQFGDNDKKNKEENE